MNSWDDDQQNSLILVPSATGGQDEELDAAFVPVEQPRDFSCSLQYSQKPGKWEKRWITLRSDGQVTYAKNEGHKEATTICHITDFDIYTPDPKTISKKIKPPKKLCFAIKSQQKSTMFMSLDTFVHFFCTSDKQIASSWYKAVQGWRSWYLVNILGEGRKLQPTRSGAPVAVQSAPDAKGHKSKVESKDSHYQIGSFKSLIDSNMFGGSSDGRDSSDSNQARNAAQQARSQPSRVENPPSAFPKWLAEDPVASSSDHHNRSGSNGMSTSKAAKRRGSTTRQISQPRDSATDPKLNASVNPDDAYFAADGLLGRSYSTRQKQPTDRDADGPFVSGGLLDSIPSHENGNGYSNNAPSPASNYDDEVSRPATSGGLANSASRRNRDAPRPLGQRAPHSYTEPLQQNAYGNRAPVPEPTMHRLSTEYDDDIISGYTNDTNSPHHYLPPDPEALNTNLALSRSSSGISPTSQPFAKDSLLAQTRDGWSGQGYGRGVMDGSKATGPMIDISQDSVYEPGSLLWNADRDRDDAMHVDRSHGYEVDVRRGEGGW